MIVYITPVIDNTIFDKYLGPSLQKLNGNANVLVVDGETGICEKYNQALDKIENQLQDDDVVCFLHDDIILHDENTSIKAEMYFKYMKNVAIAGVIGSKVYYKDQTGGWWDCERGVESAGHIIQGDPYKESYIMSDNKGMFDDMLMIDGCIMFMPGRIAKHFRFDSKTFTNFHFYDADSCFTLLSNGHDVGVVDITVEHKSIGELPEIWLQEKTKFLNKWVSLPNTITKKDFMV
jgi:hypothetical protein